jgi:hypothetical protein
MSKIVFASPAVRAAHSETKATYWVGKLNVSLMELENSEVWRNKLPKLEAFCFDKKENKIYIKTLTRSQLSLFYPMKKSNETKELEEKLDIYGILSSEDNKMSGGFERFASSYGFSYKAVNTRRSSHNTTMTTNSDREMSIEEEEKVDVLNISNNSIISFISAMDSQRSNQNQQAHQEQDQDLERAKTLQKIILKDNNIMKKIAPILEQGIENGETFEECYPKIKQIEPSSFFIRNYLKSVYCTTRAEP